MSPVVRTRVRVRVLGVGCWVLGARCWVLGAECWVLGAGCWVQIRVGVGVSAQVRPVTAYRTLCASLGSLKNDLEGPLFALSYQDAGGGGASNNLKNSYGNLTCNPLSQEYRYALPGLVLREVPVTSFWRAPEDSIAALGFANVRLQLMFCQS